MLLYNNNPLYNFVVLLFTTLLVVGFLPSPAQSETCVKTMYLNNITKIRSLSPDVIGYNNYVVLLATAWTFSGVEGTERTVIDMNFLKEIPSDATIQSATLSLYVNPEWTIFTSVPPGHSDLSGPAPWSLAKITSPWDPTTITWNNQPQFTTGIDMPAPTHNLEDYPNIDITTMVRGFVANPASNHGLMFKLQNEQHYRLVQFASTAYANELKHPKLVVNYSTNSCGCGDSGGGVVDQMDEKWSFRNISRGRGSDYNVLQNKVYFVEEAGKLSTMDIIRAAQAKYLSPSATIATGNKFLCGGTVTDTVSCKGYLTWDPATGILSVTGYMAAVVDELFANVNEFVVQRLTYSAGFSVTKAEIQKNGMLTLAVYNPGGNMNLPANPAFDYAKVQVSVNVNNALVVTFQSYNLVPRYKVLGTGYINPQDVKVTANGKVAYITERGNTEGQGAILKVDLTAVNKNRFAAVVLATGLFNPQQLVIDEARQKVYFVDKESLSVVNDHSVVTEIFGDLSNPSGLVMSSDFSTAYVSEMNPSQTEIIISKLDLVSKTKTVLLTGFTGKQLYLNWADDQKTQIYTAEARGAIHLIDVVNIIDTVIASAPCPVSITAMGPSSLVVVGVNSVHQLSLRVNLTGPLFLGIGHVPISSIDVDGYATTDEGYFFRVTNSPFGGKLSLMINHDAARKIKAQYYQVFYGGILQTEGWSDYLYSFAAPAKFVLKSTAADASKMFPVRKAIDLWYNAHLGYILETRSKPDNVLMKVEVRFFSSTRTLIASENVHIFVDNTAPRVDIGTIYHHDGANKNAVDACGVVFGSSDKFTFNITVMDDEESLFSWSLYTLWGKNKYSAIASETNTAKKWPGFQNVEVPQNTHWLATQAEDLTSRRCAHTFILTASDRSINGYHYINGNAQSHTSVTLWLDV